MLQKSYCYHFSVSSVQNNFCLRCLNNKNIRDYQNYVVYTVQKSKVKDLFSSPLNIPIHVFIMQLQLLRLKILQHKYNERKN